MWGRLLTLQGLSADSRSPPRRKNERRCRLSGVVTSGDPLEEVIVGNPLAARFPHADPSTRLAEYPDREIDEIPQGPFPEWIIEETDEDLDAFVKVLEQAGARVRRPATWPHEAAFSTIHWTSQGYYNYCPRDVLLAIEDRIIETPNVIRSRAQETSSYK